MDAVLRAKLTSDDAVCTLTQKMSSPAAFAAAARGECPCASRNRATAALFSGESSMITPERFSKDTYLPAFRASVVEGGALF